MGPLSCDVCGGRKKGEPREKALGERQEPTGNSTHIMHWAGIEPGPHWLEASVLTNAPSPLPMLIQIKAEHSRNFCWHIEEKRHNRRGVMTINNKSHFFEPLPEIPEEQKMDLSTLHSDEGLTLETSAFESLYGGQFTLSTQWMKPNYLSKYTHSNHLV